MHEGTVTFDAAAFGRRLDADAVHLRLLGTTDVHMHLHPYDYYNDRPDHSLGLAQVAGLIARMRAGAANCLLLDNGDFLQGSPMGDLSAYEARPDAATPHPAIHAMNVLKVDAATLGNHDFNFGLPFLSAALGAATFPVVSANAVCRAGATPCGDRTFVPPHALLERRLLDAAGNAHTLRIGVIGFLPPQIVVWDRRNLEGRITTRRIVEAARAHVPVLRAQGADVVIALSHSGIAGEDRTGALENATTALARVPGIDAILAGHSHLVFPGPDHQGLEGVDAQRGTVHGVPTVMPGYWGSHLGVIDLALKRVATGWCVADFEVAAHAVARRGPSGAPVALVRSDPVLIASSEAAHRATLGYVRRPVGRSTAPLHSYFAQVASEATVQIVNAAQSAHVRRAIAGTPDAALPLLSAAAPFRVGGRGRPEQYTDIPPGDLLLRHIADLYQHPNLLCAVRVTGAEIADWLEHSAGQFRRIRPGLADQPLLDPDFPSYNFDVIDGLTYQIDPTQPARFTLDGSLCDPRARRIRNLCHEGRPIDPMQPFVLATNSYRAAGGGGFGSEGHSREIYRAVETNRDVLRRYIETAGTVSDRVHETWRFAAHPGTSVTFDTGPGAERYLSEIAALSPQRIALTDKGFLRLRLHL